MFIIFNAKLDKRESGSRERQDKYALKHIINNELTMIYGGKGLGGFKVGRKRSIKL